MKKKMWDWESEGKKPKEKKENAEEISVKGGREH